MSTGSHWVWRSIMEPGTPREHMVEVLTKGMLVRWGIWTLDKDVPIYGWCYMDTGTLMCPQPTHWRWI